MADHFGATFTLKNQTPQPHNHPLGPTLDELIAWAQGDEGCITPLLPPYGALAAALRELRDTVKACEDAAPDNLPQTLAPDAPDATLGRYVVQDEHGESLLNAATPAEVVRELRGLWDRVGDEAESAVGVLSSLAPLHALALKHIDVLMALDPPSDSAAGVELRQLADAAAAWERWRYPIRALTPEGTT